MPARAFTREQCLLKGGIIQKKYGSPSSKLDVKDIVKHMLIEAEIYSRAKMDALLVENMHDVPWLRAEVSSPETVASMAVICSALRHHYPNIPIGVQVLSARNKEALAVAKAADLNFIRAEAFVYGHIRMGGFIDSCAAELVRYRRYIGADNVCIFTDIKKKHSAHAITADVSLEETAEAADMFMSDGLIVSGRATGRPTDPAELIRVKSCAQHLPVFVGSGVTADNVADYMSANGLIVGSSLKRDGLWSNDIDESKVQELVSTIEKLRLGKLNNK